MTYIQLKFNPLNIMLEKITRTLPLLGKERFLMPLCLILSLILLTNLGLVAQNTSYDQNSIPIVGGQNVGIGFSALASLNPTATGNTAVGYAALSSSTTTTFNAAVGWGALANNVTGVQNTALGAQALYGNNTGMYNTGIGAAALANNNGDNNTATGLLSLYYNSTGNNNTAYGLYSTLVNTVGSQNTAMGTFSLFLNSSGDDNTAIGYNSMYNNGIGARNTTLGSYADVGSSALKEATALGNAAIVNLSQKVRIGSTTVSVIEGQVAYSFPSDGRFKNNVSESDVKGLDFITRLRPVVYNFDTKKFEEFLTQNMPDSARQARIEGVDFGPSTAVRQSGFIAQEVEKSAQEAGYDFNGIHVPVNESDNYSLSYSQFVVPLVKAVQEQQAQIEALKRQVAALSPNSDSKGLGVIHGDQIKISPNPSGGIISIDARCLNEGIVEIYTVSGEKIHVSTLGKQDANHQVDLSQQPRGMYLVTILSQGKEVTTRRLMLQ
jgi:trimeric autotransporter adhesin